MCMGPSLPEAGEAAGGMRRIASMDSMLTSRISGGARRQVKDKREPTNVTTCEAGRVGCHSWWICVPRVERVEADHRDREDGRMLWPDRSGISEAEVSRQFRLQGASSLAKLIC